MRHYKIVVLLQPDTESVQRFIQNFKLILDSNQGKLHRFEDLGVQQLAYSIRNLTKAHYVHLNIECSKNALIELEATFRFDEVVIKHLTSATAKAPVGNSNLMRAVKREDEKKNPTRMVEQGKNLARLPDPDDDFYSDLSVLSRIGVTTLTSDLEITVDGDFENFTPKDERNLINELRTALQIFSAIEVIDISAGSIKVTLRLSAEAAEEIYWAVMQGRFAHLKVESARFLNKAAIDAILERKTQEGKFDVFICHNAADKIEVKIIARKLQEYGIRPWLDEWEIKPGEEWLRKLEDNLESVLSAAVFVGNHGIGTWQDREIQALLREFVRRGAPVIPVVLKSCLDKNSKIPLFLNGMQKVDMSIRKPNPYQQLFWGITGQRTDLAV